MDALLLALRGEPADVQGVVLGALATMSGSGGDVGGVCRIPPLAFRRIQEAVEGIPACPHVATALERMGCPGIRCIVLRPPGELT